ncbi:DeoR/GlpR family DNA-binding transcription regulator [Ancylobacter sp. VNQ12]|uniref:DeoR/GlpR family DNA-binding transcription regulator n=1 Tax=Ancylobacter sp. VNQ12 TaxID=3400920 RepID=UPI003BFF0B54
MSIPKSAATRPGPGEPVPADKKTRRQGEVLLLLERLGYASVEQLSERFGITTQTVRRDIADLSALGKVRRYHGGVALSAAIDPTTYRQRRVERVEAKRRIAARVAELVPDGASVFLDTGTTCETVAEALTARTDLKVVTYSLRAATLLSDRTDFTIAVPAGFVRNVDGSVFGEGTTDFIRRFRFDVAIIAVSGIEADGRMADDDHNEVAIVRLAMTLARSIILAADSSKFDRAALVELGNVADVSDFVTDAEPRAELQGVLREAGVRLHIS